jgi:hypothetical protein
VRLVDLGEKVRLLVMDEPGLEDTPWGRRAPDDLLRSQSPLSSGVPTLHEASNSRAFRGVAVDRCYIARARVEEPSTPFSAPCLAAGFGRSSNASCRILVRRA